MTLTLALPVTPPRSGSSPRRDALLLALAVVCLTLLFTAQDAMRRGANGGHVVWSQELAINALDWVVWGALVPVIVLIGRRIRLDGTGSRAARIAGWVALAVAFCVAQGLITGLIIRLTDPRFFGLVPPPGMARPPLGGFLVSWAISTSSLNLLIFGMTAGVFHAALYLRDLRARQLREADLQGRLARAELTVLRMQLQPHFFFNALHTVSSLMVSDVPTAQRVVAALGDLLRLSLDQTARQEVPLRDELVFVGRFLEIQQARFRNRLAVDVNVPAHLLDALVPSLVLQPLVENAIRHGIEPQPLGGRIWIAAAQHHGDLALTVRDDGSPSKPVGAGGNGSGIGLANISARLLQLYGPSHRFDAARNGDGHFVVTLTLPFHTDASLFPVNGGGAAR